MQASATSSTSTGSIERPQTGAHGGPGPTDWRFEGVPRLRREDFRALRAGYDWQPVPASASPGICGVETPDRMWPGLVPVVSPGARWLHSTTYAGAHVQHSKWGDLYLDAANSEAFFVLLDCTGQTQQTSTTWLGRYIGSMAASRPAARSSTRCRARRRSRRTARSA